MDVPYSFNQAYVYARLPRCSLSLADARANMPCEYVLEAETRDGVIRRTAGRGMLRAWSYIK